MYTHIYNTYIYIYIYALCVCVYVCIYIYIYIYIMALAKKASVLREAMLLLFEAFEVRIAKCCKTNVKLCSVEYADICRSHIERTLFRLSIRNAL